MAYSDGYSAPVEADGSFHFHDIAPGTYRLTASAAIAMYGEYGSDSANQPGTILAVAPGAYLRKLTVELFPAPESICGRVVDTDGRPVETDVEEFAAEDSFPNGAYGRKVLVELPTKRTDSTGFFAFPKLRDRRAYFIRAGNVWYPSSEDFAQAIALTPSPTSVSGCQANMTISKSGCTGRLFGRFKSAPLCRGSGFEASLYAVNRSGALFLADYHPALLADGVEFEGVCDGSYAIVASQEGYCAHQEQWQQFASPVFHVNGPTTTVTLSEATPEEIAKIGAIQESQSSPASLSGNLRFEGLTSNSACPRLPWHRVELRNKKTNQGWAAQPDVQGNFSFSPLMPGNYQMVFNKTMHGAVYIKTFEVNGKSADPSQIAVLPGESTRIDFVLSNDPQSALGHMRGDYTAPLHFLPDGTHPPGTVSGTIVGETAGGAVVKLMPTRYNSVQMLDYRTVASENGAFHFDSVFPGVYRLFAEGGKNQYSAYGAKGPGLEGMPVVLHAGENLKDISFAAYRKSSLCGKVLDSNGMPRSGVEVWVQGYDTATNPKPSGYHAWQRKSYTDDRGRYTFVEVGPDPFLWLWAELDGRRTYLPSASNTSQTQPLRLGSEESSCVYDIHLPAPEANRYEHGYSVSGAIDGKIDPELGHRFRVEIASDNPDYPSPVEPDEVGNAGEFELHGVWPGVYTLNLTTECDDATISCDPKYEARYSSGRHIRIPQGFFHRILASQTITVTNADLADLTIKLASLSSLDGEVVIDGKSAEGDGSMIDLALLERTSMFEVPSSDPRTETKLDKKGHFSFKYLNARDYGFHLYHYFTNDYVKTILLDGKPLDSTRIRLGSGQSAHLVVQVATDGAAGTIMPGLSQPPVDEFEDQCQFFSGRPMKILMIPDALPADDSGILIGNVQTNDENIKDGKLHFSAVPPGHYHILALDLLDRIGGRLMGADDVLFENHDALMKLAAFGKPVEVKSKQDFEWVAPVVTEQMMRIKAEMGLTAGP